MTDQRRTLEREILLALWKIHALHHAAQEPIYGNGLLKELRRHGYDPSPGTIYPMLARMLRHGWLRQEPSDDNANSTRILYTITPLGRETLAEITSKVEEVHRELRNG